MKDNFEIMNNDDLRNDNSSVSNKWQKLDEARNENDLSERDEEYFNEEDEVDDGYFDDEEVGAEYTSERERIEAKRGEAIIHKILIPDEILRRYDFLNGLPSGIAVIGGTARSIAREVLTGEREPIRDIDLLNITDKAGNSSVDPETLGVLGQEYMPDDYSFGHGIADDDLENYFETRDFTINQCLVKDRELLISDLAQNDLLENIIRPTYYELPYDGGELSSRIFLKAIMLQSVISQISDSVPLIEDVSVPNPEDAAYGDGYGYKKVAPFDLALFLNKAMSRGVETAMIFVDNLVEWGVVNECYVNRPMALARDLVADTYDFVFRPSTDKRFQNIPNGQDLEGFFNDDRNWLAVEETMNRYHSTDPVVAKIIEEYGRDDGVSGELSQMENGDDEFYEVTHGQYRQEDFDVINGYREE